MRLFEKIRWFLLLLCSAQALASSAVQQASEPPLPKLQVQSSLSTVGPIWNNAEEPQRVETPVVPAAVSPFTKRKPLMLTGLGALTGAAGVLCQDQFGCMLHMMTGCLFRISSNVALGAWGAVFRDLTLVSSYAAGCMLFRVLDIKREDKRDKTLAVAGTGLILFVLSDVTKLVSARLAPMFLALGFGLVNAFSMNTVGAITNASTGHLTRISLGVTDAALQQKPFTSTTSCRFIASFCTAVFVASIAAQRVPASVRFPPLGCSMGIMYAMILTWYSGVPMFTNMQHKFRLFLLSMIQR